MDQLCSLWQLLGILRFRVPPMSYGKECEMRNYEFTYIEQDECWTWHLTLDGNPFANSTVSRSIKEDARSDMHHFMHSLRAAPIFDLPLKSQAFGWHFRVFKTTEPGVGQWGFFDGGSEFARSTETKPVTYAKLDIENLKSDDNRLVEAVGRASF